jgi:alanine dehydrogenase
MIIGVPKEIKTREGRVAATPAGVLAFKSRGHRVLVQSGAGLSVGFDDAQYVAAGAEILTDAASVWTGANMVLKVKEPIASEYGYFRKDLTLFTYLHLAAEPALAAALEKSGMAAYGYETVKDSAGTLPLLQPMSEIAGRMAPIVGAYQLAAFNGGRGVLLPGVPGVAPAKVVIIGGGVSGENAARVAVGMNADVTVLDINPATLRRIDGLFHGRVKTIYSNEANLVALLPETDLLIGAVLIPGAAAPKLVKKAHLSLMKPGAVFVDIAVDQGGCAETTHATTHDNPTFVVDGVIHYCVANMPGAYARSSTLALTQAVLPYALRLADAVSKGVRPDNAIDGYGLQVVDGEIVSKPVKDALASGGH